MTSNDVLSATVPIHDDRGYFGLIDSILRNRESFFAEIFAGENLRARLRMFVLTIAALSFFYGATMGALGFVGGWERGFLQILTSGIKVPALYLLTVAVCFPVLFIILVLMGSKLSFLQTLSLIMLALTLNAVLLAAFAPIAFFFIITGSTYDFVKVLHVWVMASFPVTQAILLCEAVAKAAKAELLCWIPPKGFSMEWTSVSKLR